MRTGTSGAAEGNPTTAPPERAGPPQRGDDHRARNDHAARDQPVTVRCAVTGAAATERLGEALAGLLRPGDLVLLSGELGAGKTTLTRGLGAGLGVRGPVTSPTFVIARVHPSLGAGPALVHVDAYRLGGGLEEMEDLDLDVALPESVVVVEWGEGRVEELAENRLLVRLERATGGADAGRAGPDGSAMSLAEPDQEPRTVLVTGIGSRWSGPEAARLAARLEALGAD